MPELRDRGAGVCQDFAHLAVAGLRAMGLAARYVSGYLETTPPPGRPRMVGADASHAWASVCTGADGLDLDPTNDQLADASSVELARTAAIDDLGLPADGVVFDLLSSAEQPVTTGHADGVVTIDMAEGDEAHREALRVQLVEPYRTMLGHLRHETGHCYWTVLVEPSPSRFRSCSATSAPTTARPCNAFDGQGRPVPVRAVRGGAGEAGVRARPGDERAFPIMIRSEARIGPS